MQPAQNKTQTQFQSKVAAELWLNIAGREFRLVGKVIRFGRAADNDIVLEDKSVSRYHAILTVMPDQVILEDLKSRNGTSVGGAKIKRAELKDGDQIHIGDLPGLFYQRLKNIPPRSSGPAQAIAQNPELQKLHIEISKVVSRVQKARARFENLSKKQKLGVVVGGVLGLFVLLMLLASNTPLPQSSQTEAAVTTEEIVKKPVDRRAFERCQELEDLGNFRQATTCLRGLPLTAEVKSSIDRVKKIQSTLTEKRFSEGEQAYRNYYYDVAIQKWQEVLLIADDDSKYWAEAMRGIQEAEAKKRQK